MSTNTVGVIPVFTEADRMRKARELTGLDRAQFAELVGVSAKTVLNYESGATTRVKPLVRRAWAMATGVPASWLETGETPRSGDPIGGLTVQTLLELAGRWAVSTESPGPSQVG